MAETYTIPATDNGDGTWTANLVDNGDGTWTYTPTPARDITVAAGPVFTDWQVMGVTNNPISGGPIDNNNGWGAGATSTDWTAGPTGLGVWAAGPIWIQE